tara:strand:+ start:733 stop:1131 length:399 start_codon:yes stop_codon:yes gene_type:complete
MSTLKVNTIQNTSGGSSSTPEQIAEGRAKIWACVDGTGTPSFNDSLNCSSLTDGGTGDWIVNFSITMANTNYCTVGMSENFEGNNSDSYTGISEMKDVRTTSSLRFRNLRWRFDEQTFADSEHMGIAIFGDV